MDSSLDLVPGRYKPPTAPGGSLRKDSPGWEKAEPRPQAYLCVCVCVCVLCRLHICTCVFQCVVCAIKNLTENCSQPCLFGGTLNAERYRDEILQPVAIPYLHSLGPNSILQDDNAHPHRAGFIRDYLQNLGVERMDWPASSPDLNTEEYCRG